MSAFDKWIVFETAEEIYSFAQSVLAPDPVLPSQGKRLSDKFQGVYNQDYFYSVKNLEDALINNPENSDYGKYAVNVSSIDVLTHASQLSSKLVDFDPTWRLFDENG